MSYVVRQPLPIMLRRGENETLSLVVYDEEGLVTTPDAGTTVSVYAGTTAIVTDGDVTEGVTSTYTLSGASTTSESLAENWLIVWSTVLGGVTHEFEQHAYLVRRQLHPTITDVDLIDRHTDLAALRDPDEATFENYRVEAWNQINAELIGRGRRPQLVTGGWALRVAHIYLSLCLIFRDFASSNGNGRYQELAAEYRQLYHEEMDSLVLVYDDDEDGYIDPDETGTPAKPALFLGAPKPTYGGY